MTQWRLWRNFHYGYPNFRVLDQIAYLSSLFCWPFSEICMNSTMTILQGGYRRTEKRPVIAQGAGHRLDATKAHEWAVRWAGHLCTGMASEKEVKCLASVILPGWTDTTQNQDDACRCVKSSTATYVGLRVRKCEHAGCLNRGFQFTRLLT